LLTSQCQALRWKDPCRLALLVESHERRGLYWRYV